MNKDVRVRYMDMPCSVHAFTVKEDCESYDVYVNPKLNFESQQDAVRHELKHIDEEDFDKTNVNAAEQDK